MTWWAWALVVYASVLYGLVHRRWGTLDRWYLAVVVLWPVTLGFVALCVWPTRRTGEDKR